MHKKA